MIHKRTNHKKPKNYNSWAVRTCYPRRAFIQGLSDDGKEKKIASNLWTAIFFHNLIRFSVSFYYLEPEDTDVGCKLYLEVSGDGYQRLIISLASSFPIRNY